MARTQTETFSRRGAQSRGAIWIRGIGADLGNCPRLSRRRRMLSAREERGRYWQTHLQVGAVSSTVWFAAGAMH